MESVLSQLGIGHGDWEIRLFDVMWEGGFINWETWEAVWDGLGVGESWDGGGAATIRPMASGVDGQLWKSLGGQDV